MKGRHFNTCPVCGEDFWGRKNRIYCDDPCRHFKNNRAAEEREKSTKDEIQSYKRAYKALSQLYKEHGEEWFNAKKLNQPDLNKQHPKESLLRKQDNSAWIKLGNLYYTVVNGKAMIKKR